MKIGYILQAGVPDVRAIPRSGPANHVYHVVEELRALGHEVRLLAELEGRIWRSDDLESFRPVTPDPASVRLQRLPERAVRRVQSTFRLPYAGLFDAVRFVRACRRELRDCDVFYERMGWMGYAGALAAKLAKKPLVLEVNGDHLDELALLGIAPTGAQLALSSALTRWAARRAAHTVAAGDGWARRFRQRWGVEASKVSVVENGTEVVTLLERERLRAFRPASEADPVTVVYVGGLDRWQGLPKVVHAVHAACRQGHDVRLALIGSGPEEATVRRAVEARGLGGRVTFTGRLEPAAMAARLADADIGVSAYCGREEFSGMKLLDYKAAGLATIASGRNGEPAALRDGETARIVEPCSQEALTRALLDLAADPDLRRAMGRRARAEAEAQHSWRHTAIELAVILERLAGGAARQTAAPELPSVRAY